MSLIFPDQGIPVSIPLGTEKIFAARASDGKIVYFTGAQLFAALLELKTVNGTSLIGEGNITIEGGTMTGSQIRAALGVTTLSGANTGDQDLSGKQDKSGFVDKEIPDGDINGTNVTYTLAFTPIAGSEHVYLNGWLQEEGAGNDYQIAGAVITMADPLVVGDKLIASYRK